MPPTEPSPNLPVARATWKPEPNLTTSAECWITAGGPHHTVLTTQVERDTLEDLATIAGVELAWIDDDHHDPRVHPPAGVEQRLSPHGAAMSATTPLAIGIDFGTLSGRVLVLDLASGAELASVDVPYVHGAIEDTLPGTDLRLEPDWALQYPLDYVDVVERGIPQALAQARVDPGRVIGIGVDFTSCTVLPTEQDGTPLCVVRRMARATPCVAEALEAPRRPASGRPPDGARPRARRAVPRALRRANLVRVVLPQAA